MQPNLFAGTDAYGDPIVQEYKGSLARNTDHETSKESAADIRVSLAELHVWATACVKESPGKTQAELGQIYCPTDPRKIGRRLSECVKLGMMKIGEVRRCTKTGRSAQTYFVV